MTEPNTIRDVMVSNLLDHPSASMPALIEFGSEVPDDVTDAYAIVDRIIADERLHVALSAPPADDVREILEQIALTACESGDAVWANEAREIADAILTDPRIEVCPRGTVTPPADDVREALNRSLTGGERLTPDEAMQHAYAIAVTRTPGRMTWGQALHHFATWMREHDDRLIAEVRPRGTVTEPTNEQVLAGLNAEGPVSAAAPSLDFYAAGNIARMWNVLRAAREVHP